jgi:GT2 family glycosyltransferase
VGLRIITNEGPRAFFSKAKKFINYKKNISPQSDYNLWILKNEPRASQLKQYSNESKKFLYKPKISIITPIYNPDVAWIKSAIDSVLHQTYENWELCLADASTRKDVKKFLKKYTKKDSRIKIKFLSQNKGISGNTNEALSLATGEYISLLDHDDELSPDALYEVVKYLQDHRNADMVYSDEDKINDEDKRTDPFFKPDWSPDMFLSCMYTCHLGVYRKKIIDEIGGFRRGYDGSQDYDLVLRVIEKTKNIYHIPKILYHWRMVPGSTAGSTDSKKYAYEAAKKSIKDYMIRNDIKGEVIDGQWVGSYYVKRDIIIEPMISIIIPSKDNVTALKNCVDSILKKTQYTNYEILIINNNSQEKETFKYFDEIQDHENVHVLDYNKDFNFSAINNYAVKHSKGEVILFLNNDTKVITDTWITSMLEQVQRSEVGAVGCKLLYPDNTVQHAGIILGINGRNDENNVASNSPYRGNGLHHGYFGRENIIINLSAVTAACMMIRRDVFEEIDGFDENLAVAYNDVDLCIRLRQKGYLVVYTPFAILYHYESLSRGFDDTNDNRERFEREISYMRNKWANIIDKGDPYYNPNLSLHHGDFRIKV